VKMIIPVWSPVSYEATESIGWGVAPLVPHSQASLSVYPAMAVAYRRKEDREEYGRWLLLDSGVLHLMDGMEALDIKRLFPKILHRSRPSRKAYKNNLLHKN